MPVSSIFTLAPIVKIDRKYELRRMSRIQRFIKDNIAAHFTSYNLVILYDKASKPEKAMKGQCIAIQLLAHRHLL